MHDGWPSVLAAYGLVAGTLGVWFWMILRKLARADRARHSGGGAGGDEGRARS